MLPSLDSIIPAYSYCEHAAGVIAQPLNFLSCAVFWLGAVWMYHTQHHDDESPSFNQVTAILLFFLGLSGMMWHVGGVPVALAVDMFLLFLLFIVMAVAVANDVLRWELSRGLGAVLVLILVSALLKDETLGRLPQNGGLFLPLLFFLPLAALKVQTTCEEATVYLLSAAYTLFFGLICRSVDSLMCPYFPQGLHFLWHILIVVSVIYTGKTLNAMRAVPWPESAREAEAEAQGRQEG